MVSGSSAFADLIVWLAVLSGASLALLWLSRRLKKASLELFEAQHKAPYHSGGGLWPVILEKLSAALIIAAGLSALLACALILFYICR